MTIWSDNNFPEGVKYLEFVLLVNRKKSGVNRKKSTERSLEHFLNALIGSSCGCGIREAENILSSEATADDPRKIPPVG